MEKRKDKFTKGGNVVDGRHGGDRGGGSAADVPVHPLGPQGTPETKAGTLGIDPHVIVYGRGRENWEVLVDGHCVARFDTKAEAFQWAEILIGKEVNRDGS